MEKRDNLGKWSGGIQGESSEAARIADATERFGNLVIGFDVDGDAIGTCGDEARKVMIGAGNHQMDIEEDVVGFMDGLHHRGAKGDVIHEMAIHHIEV